MKRLNKLSLPLVLFYASHINAQVITDGSMGDIKYLSGNMTIPQNLGTTAGNNLFHSFKSFDINNGESVTFTGADNLKNVISRVTGGEISNINGLLKSEIKNANFYFINPAGVFFGEGVKVDVPAAFHISTSDNLSFKDAHVFLATLNSKASSLSITEPTNFGFLGDNGQIEIHSFKLNGNNNQSLDLVASAINIAQTDINLSAGEIRLVAMQGQNNVSIAPINNTLPLPSQKPLVSNSGNINIESSNINLEGNGSGRAVLWANTLNFNHLKLNASNNGAVNASNIKGIYISADSLIANNSVINSDVLNVGHGSKTELNIDDIKFYGSRVSSDVQGNGNTGGVKVNSRSIMLFGGIQKSDVNNNNVNSNDFALATGITSDVTTGFGNAGGVQVTTNILDIYNSAYISSDANAKGNGGNVSVIANNLKIDGENNFILTGIHSYASDFGNAGSIYVKANNLQLLNAGTILGDSFGGNFLGTQYDVTSGSNAANINVEAHHIKIDAKNSQWWTGILSELVFGSRGKAGVVRINTDTLDILNNGRISSASLNGDGGSIPSPINSNGNPGDVIINASQSIYLNKAKISTSTSGSGLSGTIQLNSPKITLYNQAEISASSSTQAYSGNIKLNVADLTLVNNSQISVANTNLGEAGKIVINATNSLINKENSFITTSANTGNGGDITINNSPLIYLQDSGFITSVSGENSNGGNIDVNATDLLMNKGVIQANAVGGKGGNISLNLKDLIPSGENLHLGGSQIINWQAGTLNNNVIQAASPEGISGIINITAPQLNLSGSMSILNHSTIELADLNKNNCSTMGFRHSSLVRGSKGSIANTESQFINVPINSLFMQNLQSAITPTLLTISITDNYFCSNLDNIVL